jgi:hypothetical protein
MDTQMTRTILATAALLAATTLATTGAQACISCEYVPPVVRASSTLPHTGHYYAAEPYQKKRTIKAAIIDRPALRAAKAAKQAKFAKAESAKAEPLKVAKAETVEKKVEKKAEKTIAKVETENSSVTLASNADVATNAKAPVEETTATTAAKTTDCKKFFASVGMTLTVPCE